MTLCNPRVGRPEGWPPTLGHEFLDFDMKQSLDMFFFCQHLGFVHDLNRIVLFREFLQIQHENSTDIMFLNQSDRCGVSQAYQPGQFSGGEDEKKVEAIKHTESACLEEYPVGW